MSSFKSSENIQKKEGGPDRSFSDNQSSSVTLNEVTMKARKNSHHKILVPIYLDVKEILIRHIEF